MFSTTLLLLLLSWTSEIRSCKQWRVQSVTESNLSLVPTDLLPQCEAKGNFLKTRLLALLVTTFEGYKWFVHSEFYMLNTSMSGLNWLPIYSHDEPVNSKLAVQ